MHRSSQMYVQEQTFKLMEVNQSNYLEKLQKKFHSEADNVFDLENELQLLKDLKM